MTNGKLPETEANSVDSQSDKAASETAGKHDEPLRKKRKFRFCCRHRFGR